MTAPGRTARPATEPRGSAVSPAARPRPRRCVRRISQVGPASHVQHADVRHRRAVYRTGDRRPGVRRRRHDPWRGRVRPVRRGQTDRPAGRRRRVRRGPAGAATTKHAAVGRGSAVRRAFGAAGHPHLRRRCWTSKTGSPTSSYCYSAPSRPSWTGPTLVPGAQLRLSGLWGRSNTADKFGYLGRFPGDFSGNTATDLRVLQANLSATAYFTPWAAGYVETLFSDVFSFPTFNQGSFQVREAYAVFGNVRKNPFYAFIGKKDRQLRRFRHALPVHPGPALALFRGAGRGGGGRVRQRRAARRADGAGRRPRHPRQRQPDAGQGQ